MGACVRAWVRAWVRLLRVRSLVGVVQVLYRHRAQLSNVSLTSSVREGARAGEAAPARRIVSILSVYCQYTVSILSVY